MVDPVPEQMAQPSLDQVADGGTAYRARNDKTGPRFPGRLPV
jgi:hypothetical protein